MLCYVDMAHPLVLADEAQRQTHLGHRLDTALRLQEIAGVPCLYQHFSTVNLALVQRHNLRALILSGIGSHWRQYDWRGFTGLQEVVRDARTPILGICGGHLVLGRLLGALVTRIGRTTADTADATDERYMPGWQKEWGFLPIDLLAPDPLFADLPPQPTMRFAHARALRTVPPNCTLLASRLDCQVQAFRRNGTLTYGVQFHPELFTADHPAGRQLLTNFCQLALS